jgi:hypothetical protein
MKFRSPFTMRMILEGVHHDDVWNGFWSVDIRRFDRCDRGAVNSIFK